MNVDEELLQALEAVQQEPEGQEPIFVFYEQLTRAIIERKRSLTFQLPEAGQVRSAAALAAEGQPYFTFDDLELESDDFLQWFQQIVSLFEGYDPGVEDELAELEAAELPDLARQWYEEGTSYSGSTFDAVLANALAPYLERAAELALPRLPLHLWQEHYCPVCGGFPDFALWNETPATTLICERCRATWEAHVVGCLFCGETEPDARGLFLTEDERYAVEVCDSCGFYLKGINARTLKPGEAPLLAAERLLTPALDLLALQDGYTRPAGVEGDSVEG